jgi:hypothetical protein
MAPRAAKGHGPRESVEELISDTQKNHVHIPPKVFFHNAYQYLKALLKRPSVRGLSSMAASSKAATIDLTPTGSHAHSEVSSPPDRILQLEDMPPEIRNLIYQFALTHDEDLYCITPWTSHPLKVCLITQVPTRDTLSNLHQDRREFNQLKYVSRRFHYETKGLELRYNDVTFVRDQTLPRRSVGADGVFPFYYLTLNSAWRRNLQRIYIRHNTAPVKQGRYRNRRITYLAFQSSHHGRTQLFSICRSNPQLKIYWEVAGFSAFLGPDLVLVGLALYNGARGCDPVGIYNPFVWCMGLHWQSNIAGLRDDFFESQDAPSNLKFLPQGTWCEEDWLKGMKRLDKGLRFRGFPELEAGYDKGGGLELWTKEIRRWYEVGV